MRLALAAALLALATPSAPWSAAVPPVYLLGPICHAEPQRPAGPHRLVMLSGMGNDRMTADTRDPEARRWFDYGLTLARSFEHADAALAFQRAQSLDPRCSLCIWGEAWARGPNINFPPPPSEIPALLALAKKAKAIAPADAPPRLRGLESALVDRYGAADAKTGDLAFAHDMDAMNRADPGDLETAIFDAEAWLVVERDGDATAPAHAVAPLTPLVPAHPDYSGLVHFYIHATEESGHPELAAPYAGRLAELAPNASHMVHMPSHTWFRIGRYEDAALANVAALAADKAYAQKTDFPEPLGALTYHAHDVSFGLSAALMSGDGKIALEMVRQFNRDFPNPATYDPRGESAASRVYAAIGQFETPRAVLAAPDTVAAQPYLEALRHYARGEAELRLGNIGAARAEAALVTLPPGPPDVRAAVIEIARRTIVGAADLRVHAPAAAVAEFAAAADLQDKRLADTSDPPAWWYPVRRDLAKARLALGDAAGALREADAVLAVWKLDPATRSIRDRARLALGHRGA